MIEYAIGFISALCLVKIKDIVIEHVMNKRVKIIKTIEVSNKDELDEAIKEIFKTIEEDKYK